MGTIVLKLPTMEINITQKGDRPAIIASGITRPISNYGMAAKINTMMYSMIKSILL